MPHGSLKVTYGTPDTERIPDQLTEGAAIFMDLRERGVLDEAVGQLRIRRQGGYCGLDVWLMLLLFYAFGATLGIKKFWEKHLRAYARALAALAGRRSLTSPSALSRALGAVEVDLLRKQSSWLLFDAPQVDAVLAHPAVQTYDARGQGWHVFDLDPTVTTLRHRALPADDDLPEPRRRSEDTGAPGYAGRKRGDIQFRRITMQHCGSGLWVHGHLSEGNGEGVSDLERALDTVVELGGRLEHPRARTLVRMDGEYGNVPWFTVCRKRGLPFITRLNRPQLYEDIEVLRRLRTATWHRVPDSRCGPQRAAADLGELIVHPGQQTRRPDGGLYEPVSIRVVASIFPKSGKAKRGRTLDGWQVELFAIDLPADAWPAPDAVGAFFGRSAEENRFAQEDRELGLDRIISYHLPGQELATLVGLSVWNLRVVRGFELETPPAERPAQVSRPYEVDERVPEHWPRDPSIRNILAELDWSTLLAKRPGWRWDSVSGELRCPEGRALVLTTIRSAEHARGTTTIIFRRPAGGCEGCSSRPACLHSERRRASKHLELAVPASIADRLRERLMSMRGKSTAPSNNIKPICNQPGPLAVLDSLFLPATARQTFAALFCEATLRIRVNMPKPDDKQPRLLAIDVADRQRRRKTWKQNADRYAAPAGTEIDVAIAGRHTLRRFLGQRGHAAAASRLAS